MPLELDGTTLCYALALLEALRQRQALDCDEKLLRAFLDTYGVRGV